MVMRRLLAALAVVPLMAAAACGGASTGSRTATITLYTCVDDTTAQPVIQHFQKAHPGVHVALFRAPTGDLNARIAGDVRSGGLRADVIWACDPLTMQDYVDQGLVGGWTPRTQIAAKWRTKNYVGVHVLYLLAISGKGVPAPRSWSELVGPAYSSGVALPDPAVAASALGALGYFAHTPDFGIGFYAQLKKNGAKQVSTPDDVVNEVAQGVSAAGVTIASSAYAAQQAGSPIQISWPLPGAIAIYGPVALVKGTHHATAARQLVSYVTSAAGQQVIANSGSYPTLAGIKGPTMPAAAPVVFPDWSAIAGQKDKLLGEYTKLFGG
jgi:iron(III) transport system substrate-binding protein